MNIFLYSTLLIIEAFWIGFLVGYYWPNHWRRIKRWRYKHKQPKKTKPTPLTDLIKNSKPLPPDIAKCVDDNWDKLISNPPNQKEK